MTTFDLDAAIAAVRAADAAAHQAKQREEQAAEAAAREHEIATLRAAARESFGELIEQLHMTIRTNGALRLAFGDGTLIYLLWYNPQYSQRAPWKISVETARIGSTTFYENRLDAADLHADLFRTIDAARYKHARMQQAAAANAEWEAKKAAQREETAARCAAQLAMHERCRQRVAAAIAETQAWPWPAGREATIFRWSWCIAAGVGGSGAEYDSGYSRAAHLDSACQVAIEPERDYRHARTLILDMQAHKPVVERLIYRAVADLPRELREPTTIEIAGITHDYSDCDPDGDPPLVERDGEALKVEAGEQPLAWVRALIDS